MLYLIKFGNSKNFTIPHAALMTTESPLYLSFFPASVKARFKLHDYNSDIPHGCQRVISLPTIEKDGYGFSEQKISSWVQTKLARSQTSFELLGYNCSAIIKDALLAGAAGQEELCQKINAYQPFIHTPGGLLSFAEKLNKELEIEKATVNLTRCLDDFDALLGQTHRSSRRFLLHVLSYLKLIKTLGAESGIKQQLLDRYSCITDLVTGNFAKLLSYQQRNFILKKHGKENFIFGLIDYLSEFPAAWLEKAIMQELCKAKDVLKQTNQKVRSSYKMQEHEKAKWAGHTLSFWKDNKLSRFLSNCKQPEQIQCNNLYYARR